LVCGTDLASCDLQTQQFGGVLAIAGALDAAQKPVLLASHNEDRVVRLWELPTFSERGELSAVSWLQLSSCTFDSAADARYTPLAAPAANASWLRWTAAWTSLLHCATAGT
jgi:hypothetical protein